MTLVPNFAFLDKNFFSRNKFLGNFPTAKNFGWAISPCFLRRRHCNARIDTAPIFSFSLLSRSHQPRFYVLLLRRMLTSLNYFAAVRWLIETEPATAAAAWPTAPSRELSAEQPDELLPYVLRVKPAFIPLLRFVVELAASICSVTWRMCLGSECTSEAGKNRS